MSNIYTMIEAARAANPVEFNKAFQAEMRGRILESINETRSVVVSEMFNIKAPEKTEEKAA